MKINVYSNKGGVGTTTVATLLATKFAEFGRKVTLVADEQEISSLTGSEIDSYNYPTITISEVAQGDDIIIIDGNEKLADSADVNIVVVNNSYMALKSNIDAKKSFIVSFHREGFALEKRDITMVMNCPVFHIPNDGTLGRKIDAGLWKSYCEAIDATELLELVRDSELENAV